jgi:hypothetical protein
MGKFYTKTRRKLKKWDKCPLLITQLDALEYNVSNHLHKEGPKLKLFNAFFKNNHLIESNAFSKSTSNKRPVLLFSSR